MQRELGISDGVAAMPQPGGAGIKNSRILEGPTFLAPQVAGTFTPGAPQASAGERGLLPRQDTPPTLAHGDSQASLNVIATPSQLPSTQAVKTPDPPRRLLAFQASPQDRQFDGPSPAPCTQTLPENTPQPDVEVIETDTEAGLGSQLGATPPAAQATPPPQSLNTPAASPAPSAPAEPAPATPAASPAPAPAPAIPAASPAPSAPPAPATPAAVTPDPSQQPTAIPAPGGGNTRPDEPPTAEALGLQGTCYDDGTYWTSLDRVHVGHAL